MGLKNQEVKKVRILILQDSENNCVFWQLPDDCFKRSMKLLVGSTLNVLDQPIQPFTSVVMYEYK